MDEHEQPAFGAVNAAEPGMAEEINRPHGEFPALSGSFARVAPFIMGQQDTVDLSEMLLRFRRREL